MYNANMSFPLKIVTGAEQTGQTTWGDYWATPYGSSWLKYIFMNLLMFLAILLVFCLFYKIIVSCITKCVTESQIKLMMNRCLEVIDQIHSSIRSMIVIV